MEKPPISAAIYVAMLRDFLRAKRMESKATKIHGFIAEELYDFEFQLI